MKRAILSFAVALVAICAYGQQSPTSSLQRYSQVLYYINNYYLDTVNFSKIVDKAIIATMDELDPHSSFISSDDVKAMNEPLEAEFEGIGVEFAIINDTLTVQAPVAGGPSEKVGILTGDKIVKVGDDNITRISLTNEMVYKYLRGKKGTEVDLTIHRKGVEGPLLFTVIRDKIPIYSVDAVYQPKKGYLYIKLSRFAASSHDEIRNAIMDCPNPIKGLIIDLRSNSGGYLFAAIDIANELLSRGDMIVYTEGRKVPVMKEHAEGNGIYRSGPLVVMIDENSASASEILSGAVQDQDRGIVIGRRSFGKGLVQQALPLSDGSQIRLTIARYHTPSGRVIQSHYDKGDAEGYYTNFYKRFANGESFSQDSIHFPDSLKFKTIHRGRTVYGGGGIMPDVFIPQDTTGYSIFYSNLLRRGVVIEYMNDMADKHRKEWMSRYSTFDAFNKKFHISEELFQGLVELAEKKGIEAVPEQIKVSEQELKTYMKALVASALYNRDSFYQVINADSPEMLKAVEILDHWNEYAKDLYDE